MTDDKIALDKQIFSALSSETRITVLKKLDSKRRTLKELCDELNLPKSTVRENLTVLVESDLVRKRNIGNKWVYYEPTEKGRRLLHPHELTKVIILLSSAALGFVGGIIEIYLFIKSAFPEEVFVVTEEGGVPLYEPKYLIFGVILLLLSVLFSYLALRMRKVKKETRK